MSTIQSKALTDSFRAFATLASPILHIHTSEDYEDALEFVEYLFDLAEDSEKDPLNNLITLISMSIEEYESNQEELVQFEQEAQAMEPSISMLRTLMNQLPNGGPKRFIPSFLASAASKRSEKKVWIPKSTKCR